MSKAVVSRALFLTLGIVAVMALLVTAGLVGAVPGLAADGIIQPTATVSMQGNIANIAISIANPQRKSITELEIRSSVPAGMSFLEATANGRFDGSNVVWIHKGAGQSANIFGFEYKVDTKGASGTVQVTVRFIGETTGTVTTTANIGPAAAAPAASPAAQPTPTPEPIRRGCLACHVLVDPNTGRYTLAFEAHERAEARGREHPSVAPDGTSMKVTDVNKVETCLLCHKPSSPTGTGGVGAPLSLRSIVHPAHMFSSVFVGRYKGNCFTCHEVRGDGRFTLIGEKMDVNDKGVPNVFPVPNLIPPSEGQ